MLGKYCFSCEDPDIISESFAVATTHHVIFANNKQQGAREMSGSGKCVEQSKQPTIDTATCIPQANEPLLPVSLFTFTLVITLLKRARIPVATHTRSCLLAAVTVTTEKARIHLVQIVA